MMDMGISMGKSVAMDTGSQGKNQEKPTGLLSTVS